MNKQKILVNNKYISLNIFRFAEEISVDDEVLVNHNGELIPEKVMNVSRLIMKGL